MRKEANDGTVQFSFIIAKSRTHLSVQYVSIPRLKLHAAKIAVRVHRMTISLFFLWTNSNITFLNDESRKFKTYVANRVSEIRDASQPSQWRHCPGTLNQADDASRRLSVRQLMSNERWFKGPAFFTRPQEKWPCIEIDMLPEEDLKVKNERAIFTLTVPNKLHELIVRYSSWTVLQRKIAWLLKFKEYLQHRKNKDIVNINSAKYLTPEDLEKATIAVVKLV